MSRLTETPLPGTVEDEPYPSSDGRLMSDSDLHTKAVIHLRQALEGFFAHVLDLYIASQLLLYYERGNRSARRDPDVMVVRGVRGRHARDSYCTWIEGVMPCTVFEITSPSTWREDVGGKRRIYQQLGITEYFLCDVRGGLLEPRLQGLRLHNGRYQEIEPDEDGCLISHELGLKLHREDELLRLYDANTGAPLLSHEERSEERRVRAEAAQRQAEDARRQAEEDRRRRAEAQRQAEEDRRRRAEAQRQAEEAQRQAEEAQRQAEDERRQRVEAQRQAEEAQRQAEDERRQRTDAQREAEELAAEVARLRALLAQNQPPPG